MSTCEHFTITIELTNQLKKEKTQGKKYVKYSHDGRSSKYSHGKINYSNYVHVHVHVHLKITKIIILCFKISYLKRYTITTMSNAYML